MYIYYMYPVSVAGLYAVDKNRVHLGNEWFEGRCKGYPYYAHFRVLATRASGCASLKNWLLFFLSARRNK